VAGPLAAVGVVPGAGKLVVAGPPPSGGVGDVAGPVAAVGLVPGAGKLVVAGRVVDFRAAGLGGMGPSLVTPAAGAAG
jgi:hypothetical protein